MQRRLALLVLLLPPSLLLLEEGFSRMMALRREERVCQLLAAVLEYTTFVHTEMYSILSCNFIVLSTPPTADAPLRCLLLREYPLTVSPPPFPPD